MLMVGHVLPFFPEYRFVYDAVTQGTFGRLKGGHFKRIISDPTWMPRFYDPAVIGGPMLDLHVHDAHFIRLIGGMPQSVQCAGSMRGEVVERFHAQFRFEDPDFVISRPAASSRSKAGPSRTDTKSISRRQRFCTTSRSSAASRPWLCP